MSLVVLVWWQAVRECACLMWATEACTEHPLLEADCVKSEFGSGVFNDTAFHTF